jgi:Nucleoporin autopeptidase
VLQQTDQAVCVVPQISEMLPQLQPGNDYHVQPSLTQLAAMAREEPGSLAHVANFTVGRPGIGSVHWLEEVDVRGVDVEGLVRLTKGGVEVQS